VREEAVTKHEGFIAKPVNIRGHCDADVLKRLPLAPDEDAERVGGHVYDSVIDLAPMRKKQNPEGMSARKAVAIYQATGEWVR
jgi:hypothetical protein